jgi:hypothetical protein
VSPSGAGLRGPHELGVSLGRRPSRVSGLPRSSDLRLTATSEESKNVSPSDEPKAKIRGPQELRIARDPRVKPEGNKLFKPEGST